jgi:hypothetical protein
MERSEQVEKVAKSEQESTAGILLEAATPLNIEKWSLYLELDTHKRVISGSLISSLVN